MKRPATFGGIDFFVDFLGRPVYRKIKDARIRQRGVTEYRNSLNAALSHKEWQDLESKMQEYGFHLENAGFFGITHRDLIRDQAF